MIRALTNSPAFRQTWVRRLALLFLIVYISVFFASSAIIIVNVNHVCIGDGCPICRLIHNAEMLLRGSGKAVAAVLTVCASLFAITIIMAAAGLFSNRSPTLVSAKIKLNNWKFLRKILSIINGCSFSFKQNRTVIMYLYLYVVESIYKYACIIYGRSENDAKIQMFHLRVCFRRSKRERR